MRVCPFAGGKSEAAGAGASPGESPPSPPPHPAPSETAVQDGTYQPLSRPIFIYVSTKANARPEVQKFVDFYLKNADKLVREVGYVPLSDAEYAKVRERFAARKTGSMFEGTDSHSQVTLEQRLSR